MKVINFLFAMFAGGFMIGYCELDFIGVCALLIFYFFAVGHGFYIGRDGK